MMLHIVESRKTLEEVVRDLDVAVTRHQFGVLGVHDLRAKPWPKKGVPFARECRIFEVCNPHQAKKVLEANLAISTALPVPDLGLRGGRDHEAGHDQADGPDRAVRDPRAQGGRRGRGDDARAHHGGGRPVVGLRTAYRSERRSR